MKKITLSTLLFLSYVFVYSQFVTSFEDKTPLLQARAGTHSATDGSSIYLTNGFKSGNNFTTEIEKYNISANTWSVLTSASIGKRYHSSEIVGNYLYVFNGQTSTNYNNKMEKIDLSTGAISTVADNPYPSRSGGSCVWNDKIYFFGGSMSTGYSNKLWVYDPALNTYTQLANMPEAKEVKGEVVNGVIYTFGGFNGTSLSRVDTYNIATNTWTHLGYLLNTLSANSIAVNGDKIWLIGDYTNTDHLGYFDTVNSLYYAVSNNMQPRRHLSSEIVNGTLYVMGGNTNASFINSMQSSALTLTNDVPVSERDALIALYNSTNGASWTDHTNWNTTMPVTTWYGIVVSDVYGVNRVTQINIQNNNMVGTLPDEIGNLPELTKFWFYNADLYGTIPSTICNLTKLNSLALLNNQNLTGEIPSCLANITTLKTVYLSLNKLSGTIPDFTPNILLRLYIKGNEFEFGDFENQHQTYLNQMSGSTTYYQYQPQDFLYQNITVEKALGESFSISTNVSGSQNQYQWYKDDVLISGANAATLDFTNITANDFGSYYCVVTSPLVPGMQIAKELISVVQGIPQAEKEALIALYNATNGPNWINNTNWLTDAPVANWHGVYVGNGSVSYLSLYSNNLVGTLPAELGNLTNITGIDFYDNYLTGTFPDLTGLSYLEYLYLQKNEFSLADIESHFTTYNTTLDDFYFFPQRNLGVETTQDINVGSNYEFTMPTVAGTGVTYQWFKNDEPIAGATSQTYSITNAQMIDAANYHCRAYSSVITGNASYYIRNNTYHLYGPINTEDYNALLIFYYATGGPNWTNNTNWATSEPVYNWYGVTVEGTRVTELNLVQNNLDGIIPPQIDDLTALKKLYLTYNQLHGSIPAEMGNLTNLKYLYLNNNQFSGSIPNSIGNLTSLIYLDLSSNQLSGSIPTEIGNLINITTIYLNFNQLSGIIPSSIGNLFNLVALSLWNNNITGNIPSEMGNCIALRTLSLEDNYLTGNIPSSFANLTNMNSFWLNGNNLSGDVPDIFSNWDDLYYFSLGNSFPGHEGNQNQLTGNVDLSHNSNLKGVWLSDLLLSGIDLRNGNNSNITSRYFKNNPNLTCIYVDNVAYSTANWTNISSNSHYVNTEAECASYLYPSIGIIGSAVPTGWEADIDMQTTDGVIYTLNNYAFSTGELKFRQDNGWNINWGGNTFPTGTGILGGSNIQIAAGTYNVTFNRSTYEYDFELIIPEIGIIGTAINGGSEVDTDMYSYDGLNYFINALPVDDGFAYFRQDNNNTINWSNVDFPYGQGIQDGAQIPTTANLYNVSFNRPSGYYQFDYVIISMVGDFNNWTNDVVLGTNDGINYSIEDFILGNDSNIKFRQNHSFATNWGSDTFPSGVGVLDGLNIPATAGVYDIMFNRLTGEYQFIFQANVDSVGIIGSAINGGSTEDTDLLTSDNENYYINALQVSDGTAYFRLNNTDDINWSSIDFPYGIGYQNGDLIPVTNNLYNITFHKNSGNYSFDFVNISIIGAFNSWLNDVTMNTTDGVNYTLNNFTLTEDGFLKFRQNYNWSVNWGSPDFPNGFGTSNQDAIPAIAGTYNITFNRITGEYNFEEVFPIISLVGDFNGWSNDLDMQTTDGVNFSIAAHTFSTATTVKFRQNHAWDNNWGGDTFPSGVGISGGSNISVPAGTYHITFNFNTKAYFFDTNLATEEFSENLTVYPNPTSGILNIDKEFQFMQVFDVSGKKIKELRYSQSNQYDVSELQSGMYLLKVIDGNQIYTQKVIKN